MMAARKTMRRAGGAQDKPFIPFGQRPAWREARLGTTAYLEEVRAEILRHARMPGFLLLALLLPSLFYAALLCGLSPPNDRSGGVFRLANGASLAAISPGLFAVGGSVAYERHNGFLTFKRALPMPRCGYFGAKFAMCMLLTLVSFTLLLLLALLTGQALPTFSRLSQLVLVEMVGTLPFCTLGMLIGSFADSRRVVGIVNLALVPTAFFSGLLLPMQILPQSLRYIAVFSPGYNLLAMTLASVTPGCTVFSRHALFLLFSTIIVGALAQWRLGVIR